MTNENSTNESSPAPAETYSKRCEVSFNLTPSPSSILIHNRTDAPSCIASSVQPSLRTHFRYHLLIERSRPLPSTPQEPRVHDGGVLTTTRHFLLVHRDRAAARAQRGAGAAVPVYVPAAPARVGTRSFRCVQGSCGGSGEVPGVRGDGGVQYQDDVSPPPFSQ